MVKVEGLCKSFVTRKRKNQILKDISFTAHPGEIYGLLGPNGAGKTTTLRTIATLLKPDRGTVQVENFFCGRDDRKVRDIIGLLTSDMKLSGNLTPRELIGFFGELNHLGKEQISTRRDALSTYLDMEDFLDKPMEKLSTGMKQKTAIAISLIHDPRVIMFDEPTSGLDILAAKVVIDFLMDYKKQGKTVIFSTHIMAEAEKLCDRIGIILKGELVFSGTIEELKNQTGASSLEEAFFVLARTRGIALEEMPVKAQRR